MQQIYRILFCLFLCSIRVTAGVSEETSDGVFASIQRRYDQLSPKGKAVAGATVGFVGSRLALRTVTKVVKFGAAAFITAEALRLTGVMDEIPALSSEQSNLLSKAKGVVLQTTEDFRVQIRRTLSRDSIQNFFDEERMAAFGFAGGAIAGAVL